MTPTFSSNELIRLISQAEMRPSVHRLAVLDYVANRRTHPTSDEIFDALSVEFPSMSRTTVYNSLHALVDGGLLCELPIESGKMRYDFRPQSRHCHFLCRQCGKVADMPYPDGMNNKISGGYVIDNIDVYYRGLCPQCAANATNSNN